MDLLADILTHAGLKKRVLHQRALTQPWALNFPCPFSIGFHVVNLGDAYLWTLNQDGNITGEAIHLQRGDIAFMSRGVHHTITTHKEISLVKNAQSIHDFDYNPSQAAPILSLVSGAYQMWNTPLHPLFRELPEWMIIRADSIPSFDSIHLSLQLLAKEFTHKEMGSEPVIESLLDILFHLILRRILEQNASQAEYHSWGRALEDPHVMKALCLMHQDTARDWTLDLLAQEVDISRSGFAIKFKKALGDTPLHYLSLLRMQQAMELLATTQQTLENIATSVGYQDAFGFSKAFKKITGSSPREFRRQNQNAFAQGRFS